MKTLFSTIFVLAGLALIAPFLYALAVWIVGLFVFSWLWIVGIFVA